jgi:hypothetical protein
MSPEPSEVLALVSSFAGIESVALERRRKQV